MDIVAIQTSEVRPATKPLESLDVTTSVARLLQRPVVASRVETRTRQLVECKDTHPLAEAACSAFYRHYPLILTPDAVWFTLAQGLAQHVALNTERLRNRFVRHEGKLKLSVMRPDFQFGPDDPWPEVFAEFSTQIAAHTGLLYRLVVADFTTTGPVERAASEVLLMDTVQGYFEYELMGGCGIPTVMLHGTVADWRSVRSRAQMFAEYELQDWTSVLMPVLDQFVNAAEGRIDREFWRSFFRYESGSGPAELTGWINVLFPFLREGAASEQLVPSPYISQWQAAWQTAESRSKREFYFEPRGPALELFPSGLAGAPVKAKFLDGRADQDIRFVAGLFGVGQDPATLALNPEFGWAVVQ